MIDKSKLIVLCDSREQRWIHIENRLQVLKIAYKVVHLLTSDYSFIYDGVDYTDKFGIERKANWSEIAGNVTKKPPPKYESKELGLVIKLEFERAKVFDYFALLIEDKRGYEGMEYMKKHNYKTNLAFQKRMIKRFITNRSFEFKEIGKDLKLIYCNKTETANIILNEIERYLIEKI
mgnify:FL=1